MARADLDAGDEALADLVEAVEKFDPAHMISPLHDHATSAKWILSNRGYRWNPLRGRFERPERIVRQEPSGIF